jgi:hypothetical protein
MFKKHVTKLSPLMCRPCMVPKAINLLNMTSAGLLANTVYQGTSETHIYTYAFFSSALQPPIWGLGLPP